MTLARKLAIGAWITGIGAFIASVPTHGSVQDGSAIAGFACMGVAAVINWTRK